MSFESKFLFQVILSFAFKTIKENADEFELRNISILFTGNTTLKNLWCSWNFSCIIIK